MRKNSTNNTLLSAHYLNNKQIDNICNVITDRYTEKKLEEGKIVRQIDIEDLAINFLGCNIVYENINEEEDCLGFLSDGIVPLPVIRNGRKVEVVFPKDTIVIDNYLNFPKQLNRKRFTIAHEAGHVVKNRMYNISRPEYSHEGGIILESAPALHRRYSYKEVESNRFAASLLMPESTVAMLMHKLFEDKKIIRYPGNILGGEDTDTVASMAKFFGVSYSAMVYRLKDLGYFEDGELETYVEDNVLGEPQNE